MKKRFAKKGAILLAGMMMVSSVLALGGCGTGDVSSADQGQGDSGGIFHKEEPVELSILCVGDVMAHSTNIKAAYDASAGSYDFSDNYEYVTPYIADADLALCNVETTFEGTAPRGYPTFNAPDSLAEALKAAGFDVALTSNNHMMDSGFGGMQRTLEILRAQGFVTAGSRFEGEESFAVTDVKGVKVGIVSYTYETTGAGDSGVTINGNRVGEEAQALINTFNYNELETTDYGKIQADIEGARGAGAELVVCYLHWGEEYQREPNSYQLSMAQRIADMGADIIFASHPHVLQKVDTVVSGAGKKVPVFYSMGNFISNQREETLPSISNRRYTEQGMMARVDISLMKSTGEIVAETVRVIPTWVDRYNGSSEYRIIPLDENLDSNAALGTSGHLARAKQGLADVKALLGEQWLTGVSIEMGTATGDMEDETNEQAA